MKNHLKDDPRYSKHESRPDLAGEHPQGDLLQLLAFILFVIAILFDHFFLGWAIRFRGMVPFEVRLPISMVIILSGGLLSIIGVQTVFSEYTEQPRMITTSLFSFVRHPVYLGGLLVYLGLIVFFLSPLAFLVFIAVFLFYNWLARDEELRMLKVFGMEYEAYCRKTPRWLPRLFIK